MSITRGRALALTLALVVGISVALSASFTGRASDAEAEGTGAAGDPAEIADLEAAASRLLALSKDPKDVELALQLIRRAADQGSVNAIFRLGVLHLEGEAGAETNPELARALLEDAAAKGSSKAALRLGTGLVRGEGVPPDPETGVRLLTQAAASASEEVAAAMELGNAYLEGAPGLAPDSKKAREYFERAAAGGRTYPRLVLGRGIAKGELPGDRAEGIAILEDLVASGDDVRNAALELGVYYLESDAADPEKARAYLKQSAEAGNDYAEFLLARGLLRGDRLPAEPAEAVALLERQIAEDRGAARAAQELGAFYLTGGRDVAADAAKARSYLERAFDDGRDHAGVLLARALLRGEGLPADTPAGIALLERQIAEDRGAMQAAYELGSFYLRGGGEVDPDAEKARAYLEDAISAGHGYAPVLLSRAMLRGEGLPRDVSAGIALLLNQISKGQNVGNAAYEIGAFYLTGGAGVPANPEKARSFLQQSADAGHGYAPFLLGSSLIRGQGVEADPAAGIALLEALSEEPGNTGLRATVELGKAYRDGGDGLPPDPAKARGFLERAADAGSADALMELGYGELQGKFAEVNGDAALAYFERAAEAGHDRANFVTGQVQLRGWGGVERNIERGLSILEEEAEGQSNPNAMRELASAYRSGIGEDLPRNLARARTWFERYAEVETDPANIAVERLLLTAAQGADQRTLRQVTEQYIALPSDRRQSVARQIFWINKNAAVHVAQAILRSAGFYQGPINGLLTAATIGAIRKACEAGSKGSCPSLPLHVDTFDFLAANFS